MSPDGIFIAARVGFVCIIFSIFVSGALKSRYRYDSRITGLCLMALVAITVAVTIVFLTPGQLLHSYSSLGILLWICLAVAVFCIIIKGAFLELVFTVLVVLNLYVNIMAIVRVIAVTLPLDMTETMTETVVSFGVILLYIPFLYVLFIRFYKPVIELDIRLPFWRVIWIIPAMTYLVFFVKFINDYWRRPVPIGGDDIVFCVLWSLTTYVLFLVTLFMLLQSYRGIVAVQRARHMSAQLQMQEDQYERMMGNIENTARLRHDWRHHLRVIDGFAGSGSLECIREYLQQMMPEYMAEAEAPVCENHTVDILLRYYRSIAAEFSVTMEISAKLPGHLNISDPDLGIVFGNILENAVQACKNQTSGQRSISVRTFMKESQLVLMVRNTYDNPVTQKDGKYVSTKHAGNGRGIESVRGAVERYHGILRIGNTPPYFDVHILMNLPGKENGR